RLARPAVVAATLAVGAAGGWGLLARGAEHRRAPAPLPASPAPVRARPVAAAPARRVDSLPWTVQLAAYARLDKALALADRLRARGIPAVSWGTGSRLLAGAFETPEQASVLEARLKRAGVQATLVTRIAGETTP